MKLQCSDHEAILKVLHQRIHAWTPLTRVRGKRAASWTPAVEKKAKVNKQVRQDKADKDVEEKKVEENQKKVGVGHLPMWKRMPSDQRRVFFTRNPAGCTTTSHTTCVECGVSKGMSQHWYLQDGKPMGSLCKVCKRSRALTRKRARHPVDVD